MLVSSSSKMATELAREREPGGVEFVVQEDPRLRERCFGILEGLTREESRRKHPDEVSNIEAKET